MCFIWPMKSCEMWNKNKIVLCCAVKNFPAEYPDTLQQKKTCLNLSLMFCYTFNSTCIERKHYPINTGLPAELWQFVTLDMGSMSISVLAIQTVFYRE